MCTAIRRELRAGNVAHRQQAATEFIRRRRCRSVCCMLRECVCVLSRSRFWLDNIIYTLTDSIRRNMKNTRKNINTIVDWKQHVVVVIVYQWTAISRQNDMNWLKSRLSFIQWCAQCVCFSFNIFLVILNNFFCGKNQIPIRTCLDEIQDLIRVYVIFICVWLTLLLNLCFCFYIKTKHTKAKPKRTETHTNTHASKEQQHTARQQNDDQSFLLT